MNELQHGTADFVQHIMSDPVSALHPVSALTGDEMHAASEKAQHVALLSLYNLTSTAKTRP
jgi:hypothetical protein